MALSVSFLISTFQSASQTPLLPNEESMFSFKTTEGRAVLVAKDTSDRYLTVRMFEADKIKLEYPYTHDSSWSKFTYTYFFRPDDGKSNGLDLNYLEFTHDACRYIIYDIHYEPEGNHRIGMKSIEPINEKENDLKAIPETVKGDLSGFRYSDLIRINIGQQFE